MANISINFEFYKFVLFNRLPNMYIHQLKPEQENLAQAFAHPKRKQETILTNMERVLLRHGPWSS